MSLDAIVRLIKDVGFPIGVAIYLLVRFDRLMMMIVASQSKELEIMYQLRDYMLYDLRSLPREIHSSRDEVP